MAKLDLHQQLTDQKQSALSYKDLDCMIKWVAQLSVEDSHLFGLDFIFRHGMPGKGPTGEWGYYLGGDMGMHERPNPKPLDHRVSMRYPETPTYEIKLGSLYEVISVYTNYYHRDYLKLENPYRIIENHLAALSKTLPNYLEYLVYKIFAGTEAQKENFYIKDWIVTYIEPSDGAQNGYKFRLSEGWGTVNLSEVITKQKKTDHPLKTKLEQINKDLRADARKVEVDTTKIELLQKGWVSTNMTAKGKKVLGLYKTLCDEAFNIIRKKKFDIKYKHKNDANSWEGIVPIVESPSQLIGIMNDLDWKLLKEEVKFANPVTEFSLSEFDGRFIVSPLIDPGEALIVQEGLIQCGILPQLIKYDVYDYSNEATRDFIYEMGHTIDVVPVFCSMYLKLKA